MPIRISDLVKETRPLSIPLDDEDGEETLNITYRPSAMTPAVEAEMHQAISRRQGGAALVAPLSHLIVTWDVVDEAGEPLPVTTEVLNMLPIDFLSRIITEIGRDMNPNAGEAVSSFGT